jgi:hypothetical protein
LHDPQQRLHVETVGDHGEFLHRALELEHTKMPGGSQDSQAVERRFQNAVSVAIACSGGSSARVSRLRYFCPRESSIARTRGS